MELHRVLGAGQANPQVQKRGFPAPKAPKAGHELKWLIRCRRSLPQAAALIKRAQIQKRRNLLAKEIQWTEKSDPGCK